MKEPMQKETRADVGRQPMAIKDAVVRVTVAEQLRIQAIVLDRDKDDALEFVKMLRDRIDTDERHGMRSHLDQ